MKVCVLGLGNRGHNYIRWMRLFCKKDIEVVAVCDKNPLRLENTQKAFKIPKAFGSDDELFANGAIADAIIIATQDRDHIIHCTQAIDAGYKHILVEKPVSPDIEACERLLAYGKEHGVDIVVCHVLRYSKHYAIIKKLIDDGEIGDIMNINHVENVGDFHYAHSYVRGCWHDSTETSPFIMAKCCHDFDLFHWFVGAPCVAVSSFGENRYFTHDYAPDGAAERCVDCKVKCPYNAENLYIKDSLIKATFVKFMGGAVTGKPHPTKDDKYEALKNGSYGKCVYHADNNVADRQIVNMQFKNGAVVTHTATAFSNKMHRRTQICGSLGDIIADDLTAKITLCRYHGKKKVYRSKPWYLRILGHVDGDINLIKGWSRLISGKEYDKRHVTFLEDTIASHKIAMAAEESRLSGGRTTEIE